MFLKFFPTSYLELWLWWEVTIVILLPHRAKGISQRSLWLKISWFRVDQKGDYQGSSVQCTVMSNSLQLHELQDARLPCPSTTPRACWNMSIKSMMTSNHFILCSPLLFPPSIFPSIRVFSNELVLRIRWPKDWSFSFSISPSNGYSGMIFFRIDWFDLAVQGTLKSLL